MKKETANQPKKLPVEGSTEALQARINQLEIKRIAIVTGHAEKVNPLTNKPQNFSKYVKQLIEEDMKRETNGGNNPNGITIDQNLLVLQKEVDAYSIEVKNTMSSFL